MNLFDVKRLDVHGDVDEEAKDALTAMNANFFQQSQVSNLFRADMLITHQIEFQNIKRSWRLP
ncbi:hypothetical protein N9P17_06210 [Tateyamaria sp.]|nr:hypothetical protein [Tateyamaria sp.]